MVKSLAEVTQPDGSTRWELIELREAAPAAKAPEKVEEKPKRTRKVSLEPVIQPTETPDF